MKLFTKLIGLTLAGVGIFLPVKATAASLGAPLIDPLPNYYLYDNEETKYLAGQIQTIVIFFSKIRI